MKVGDKLICIKEFLNNGKNLGKTFIIERKQTSFYINGFYFFEDRSRRWCIYNHFITPQEYRKQKLKKLQNETI